MSRNSSGPTSTARGEAQEVDQLSSQIDCTNTKSAADTQARTTRKRRAGKLKQRCRWVRTDGGRRASGFRDAGDRGGCVPRAIAIATRKPYREVHDALTEATARYVRRWPRSWIARWIKQSRGGRGYDPAHGSYDKIYGPYLESFGWRFTSTEGRKVYLRADELPPGRLIVRVHRHLVAAIDGVIHDTYNSARAGRRPVYGYYTEASS